MQYYVNKDDLQYFVYNGMSSADFGIVITNTNQLSSPERNVEIVEIDGRDEPLIIDKGNFKPFELKITCSIDSEEKNINDLSRDIKMWLQSDFKLKKLILSDDLEYYYNAACVNKLDIEEVIKELGEFELTFLCDPLKRYEIGDSKIILKTHKTIQNYWYESKPLIRILGNGDITININDQKVIFKGVQDEIEIDSNIMNAYKIDKFTNNIINENSKMYSDFPVIEAGKNNISWTGDVLSIEITPRWVVL